MAATSVANGGEIFIMSGNTKLVDPFPSTQLIEKQGSNTGSLRSTHSALRGLSVFVDPNASASLPRDVEMSVSLYETKEGNTPKTSTKYVQNGVKTTTETTVTTHTNKDIGAGTVLQNGKYTESISQEGTSVSTKSSVKKAGSFQFKAAEPFPVTRSASQRSEATPGESYSRVYKAVTTSDKRSKESKQSHEMTLPLKIATSGTSVAIRDTVDGKAGSSSDISQSLKKPDRSVTSYTVSGDDHEPASGLSSTSSLSSSVSAPLSPQSSVSSVPTVVNKEIASERILQKDATEKYTDSTAKEGAFKMQSGKDSSQSSVSVSRQDSGSVFEMSSQNKSESASQHYSNTSTLTSVTQISETGSVVKNKEFKSRMNEIIASNTSSLERSKAKPSPGKLSIQSSVETKKDYAYQSQTFPRDQKTEDEIKIYKSTPTSPIDEMNDSIKSGTVGSLAKSGLFKHLTGRSMDPSTLERKKQRSKSQEQESASPPLSPEKKFKFVVAGIDVPAEDDEQEKTDKDKTPSPVASPPVIFGADGIPLAPPPPPPPYGKN